MMKLLKYFKIYDNELCPCDSGKPYINCCKNRKDKTIKASKKPLEIQVMEQFRKSQFKCCLYPDKSNCVKHIKEAHALQNNKIISQLAEEGHVYILNTKKSPIVIPIENEEPEIIIPMDRVGIKHATTATCFCDIHDDEAFALIEKGAPDFDPNNKGHKFIYAYKSFIFEYYKKLVEQKVFIDNVKQYPSLLKIKEFVRYYRAISMTLQEMDNIKDFFDKRILNKDYTGLETCILEIPESINFANYACLALDFDINGNKIKYTHKGFISRLFVTVFPEKTKSYVIMSCLKEDYSVYKKLFYQLQNINLNKIKYYLDLVLPLYSENIVISPRLWEKWDDEQQMIYTFLANRQRSQFLTYKTMFALGMRNLKKQESNFEDGNRGRIDLFQKV